LISITGRQGPDLYEVDEAATRIREEVNPAANGIVGSTFELEPSTGIIRVVRVATASTVANQSAESALSRHARRFHHQPAQKTPLTPSAASDTIRSLLQTRWPRIKPSEHSRIADSANVSRPTMR